MRKKYLSALLFGALLFASAGTFTSCKDYDDDINNLQNQITANADAIKALQELVNNGDYVTKVAKNADGNLVFTFSKSGDQVITLDEEQVGDVLSINAETGELIKNGEPTGWFATKNEEKEQQNCIKIGEDGCWQLLQDDGTYKSTNIPVSGVTAVQNTETKQWTLTIVDAQGNSQQVVIPSAASVMQDLELMGWATAEDASEDLSANLNGAGSGNYTVQNTTLDVKYAYVSAITYDGKETTWSAQKDVTKGQVLTTLAPTNTKLVARVAPADLDLSGMNFTLQDSKGNKLPIALKTSEAFTGTLTRAASGISYIPMDITTDTYKSAKEYTDLFNEDALYSLVEESGARSTYGQFNIKATPATVSEQSVKTVGGKAINGQVFDVDVNTPNKLTFGDHPEYVYDYYVEAKDQAVANLFNVSIDKKNGTFTVGKLADQITTTTFTLYVYALHIDGTIYRSEIVIKPSRKIVSEAVLAAGKQVIKQSTKADGTAEMANFMKFEVSLDEMFNNMSASDKEKWTSATLGANTAFDIVEDKLTIDGKKATLANATDNFTNYYQFVLLDADGKTLNEEEYYKAKTLRVYAKYIDSNKKATLQAGKEYSLTINFQNKNTSGEIGVLNTVKLTYTPTLPALSDYMVKHPSFWSDNTLRGISQVDNLTFATQPASQKLSYAIEDGFKTLGSEKAADKMDITFSLADNKVDNAEFVTVDKDGKVVSYTTTAGVASKQYGKEFTVNVNATYLDAYTYSEDVLKAQSFKMVVLSPVYEGSIDAETALEVEATAGAKLSMADIIAQNYNKQRYSLYLSKVLSNNKAIDVNAANPTADIFDYAAIKSVEVTSGDEKVFTVVNSTPSAATWNATSKSVVPGTVEISTKEISNDTETYIKVKVTDVWGYAKEVEIPLTIKMAK